MSISSLNDINYFCFNSNPIFIIPHDLYDYNNQQNKFSKEIKSLKSTENNNSFEKMKILKQLGIKN